MAKNRLRILNKMFVIDSSGTINLRKLGKNIELFLFKARDLVMEIEACDPSLLERLANRDSYLIAKIHGEGIISFIHIDVLHGEQNEKLGLFYPEVREFLRDMKLDPTHLLHMGFSGFAQGGGILEDALGFEINPSKERCDEAEEFARELKKATAEIVRIAYSTCFSNGAEYERRFCYEVSQK